MTMFNVVLFFKTFSRVTVKITFLINFGYIPYLNTEPYPPPQTENRLGTQRSCSSPFCYIDGGQKMSSLGGPIFKKSIEKLSGKNHMIFINLK